MADDFETLLEEALADPDAADFERLRAASVHTDFYLPFGRDNEDLEELSMRIATGNWAEAQGLVEELLATDPLGIQSRLAYAKVLEARGEEWEAGSQRAFAHGLLRSILRSGDGRSTKHPIQVLDMRELSLVLDVMGLRALRSELTCVDGRWIDSVEAVGAQGERLVHFDVHIPQTWLLKLAGR